MTLSIGANSIHSFDSNSGPFSNSQAQDQAYDPYDPWQGQNPSFGPQYTGQDSTMDEYNQKFEPGMQNVADIYKQAMCKLANFGFNENNITTDTNKEALKTFQEMLNDPNGPGGSDGVLVEQEARDALDGKDGKKYTEQQKAALNYILNVKQNDSGVTLWKTLCGADGVVSNKDVNPALEGNLDPNSLTPNCLTPYK